MSIYLIEIKFSFSNGTMSHTIEAKQLKEFKPYRLVQALHLSKSVSQFVREFQSPPLFKTPTPWPILPPLPF